MSKSKQRLLEINAMLADNVSAKGVQASKDETTTSLVHKVEQIKTAKPEQEKAIEITKNGTTEVLPDNGKTLSKVSVEVDVKGEPVFYTAEGRMYKESIEFPETVTSIGESAFQNCTGLTSVVIPDSVTSIGNYAFQNCTGLTNVVIPDGVTSIGGGAFRNCSSLTSITIPDSVTSIGIYAFARSNIKTINIGNGLQTLTTNCFRTMTKLELLRIPNSVKIIQSYAIYECFSLKSLYLPNSLEEVSYTNFHNSPLEFVILEDNFNCSINLSHSSEYSRETIVSWFNALADRTGKEAYKLIIDAENIAKLTEEDIAIATAKNWTIS